MRSPPGRQPSSFPSDYPAWPRVAENYCRQTLKIFSDKCLGGIVRAASTTVSMTRILHRQIGHSYPVATAAGGIMIRDSAGKEYIDASGGAAVSCLGHSHPDVLAAMHSQLDQLAYAHTSFFTSQAAEELADELAAHAPQGLN